VTAPDLGALAAPVVATDGDRAFAALVTSHFDDLMERDPAAATYLGIHAQDHRLPDLSRGAFLEGVAAESRYETALEAIDPATLSPATAFERDVALLSTRRARFDAEVHGAWERRARAADIIGDALFLLFAPFRTAGGTAGGDHGAAGGRPGRPALRP